MSCSSFLKVDYEFQITLCRYIYIHWCFIIYFYDKNKPKGRGVGCHPRLCHQHAPALLCFPVFSRVISKVAICQYHYVNTNILFPVFIVLEGRDLIVVCNVQPNIPVILIQMSCVDVLLNILFQTLTVWLGIIMCSRKFSTNILQYSYSIINKV